MLNKYYQEVKFNISFMLREKVLCDKYWILREDLCVLLSTSNEVHLEVLFLDYVVSNDEVLNLV
jgi:hypothetical protein